MGGTGLCVACVGVCGIMGGIGECVACVGVCGIMGGHRVVCCMCGSVWYNGGAQGCVLHVWECVV